MTDDGHCLICFYRSGLRVMDDPGHRHVLSTEPTPRERDIEKRLINLEQSFRRGQWRALHDD